MKLTLVFLSAVLITACAFVLESEAGPFKQEKHDKLHEESQNAPSDDLMMETSHEQTSPLALFRTKRQSHLSLCRVCCNCCKNKGCGFCCRF